MKTLIIYKSAFGSTKQYAKWLGEDIQAEVVKFEESSRLNEFDRIIVMSGTYIGFMPLIEFLKKHWDILKSKKVYAVANGAMPMEMERSIEEYKRIPQEIRDNIKYVKIMGATPFVGKEKKKLEVVRKNLDKVLEILND